MHTDEYSRMYHSENELWWYKGLRSYIKLQMDSVNSEASLKILDVGCGTGSNLQLYRNYGKAFGIDVASEAVHFSRKRGISTVARASIFEMPFADSSFDLASCMDVLGHSWVVDDVQALEEIYRVLKPGGRLFIHVAALEALRGQHDEVIMFSRRYSRTALVKAVEQAGFTIERMTFRNSAFMPILFFHRTLSRLRRNRQTDAESDVVLPHPLVNRAMFLVLKLENQVANRIQLPIGSSLFCVARR